MIVGWIRRLLADRKGGTAIEYGLICALIVVVMLGALASLANKTSGMWNRVSTAVIAVPVN